MTLSSGSVGEPLLTNSCVDLCHPEVFRASVCSLCYVVLGDVLPESSLRMGGQLARRRWVLFDPGWAGLLWVAPFQSDAKRRYKGPSC